MTERLEPPTSRAAGQIKVDLGVETKRAWMQRCTERGLVPSKAVRSLVEQALADGPEQPTSREARAIQVTVATQPDHGPKVGREIQFTPTENAAIEAVAGQQGFGFQEWVIAAVRAALANAPSYGQLEIEALTQGNRGLTQIVRELRDLRAAGLGEEQQKQLKKLENEIRKHIEQASLVMAKGAQRWQLKI